MLHSSARARLLTSSGVFPLQAQCNVCWQAVVMVGFLLMLLMAEGLGRINFPMLIISNQCRCCRWLCLRSWTSRRSSTS